MKKNKQNKTLWIGGTIALMIILILVFTFTPFFRQTALNTGGRVFFDYSQVQSVYNISQGETIINAPFGITIYLGTGWDNVCFSSLTRVYLKDMEGNIIKPQKFHYSTINHDADRRNIPAQYGGLLNMDISQLSQGRYELEAKTIIGIIDDRPSIGDCGANGEFGGKITNADSQYNFETSPVEWMLVFEDTPNYYQSQVESRQIYVINEETCGDDCEPLPMEIPIVPIAIGTGIVGLGVFAYFRMRKKK